ncbi:hypothetical protein EZV73_27730 [Acidaminobacter sp. JC074]|uniref:dihydrolipoyl dehydrogenase family protein n=1 Tax=Acidaminobacter sp. JC074 TaxID=2530199 RepID=UPI001F10E703|nr:FAD-dependent oxidoreductase [Acidaminobacter sp. JC074]MCH4891392.1 hypothetical protein [Acidaminobacter sp. JC074]
MKYDYHIIVIGAGSAGLVVASGASNLGAKVALIEGHKMGGDCLNYGCVPSKTFLHSAHTLQKAKKLKTLNHMDYDIQLDHVMKNVSDVISDIAPHDSIERYESLGVKVYEGYASIKDGHTVLVNNQEITGKNIVIATGSSPFIPDIQGLNQVDYHTNETIFTLKKKPKRLIVLGAGPIGLELGQGFSHLGSRVTIISRSKEIFKKEEPEVSGLMMDKLTRDGLDLKLGYKILKVDKKEESIFLHIEKDGQVEILEGDQILLALGRQANTSGLNLQALGVKTLDKGFIKTNNKLMTDCPSIYACGDVVGPYLFTHMASYQASIVIQNTIFPIKRKTDYTRVPWVTYTLPEVAHIGKLENHGDYDSHFIHLKDNDRAKANHEEIGFLKLITDKKGVLVGASMVSEHAGEQIALANLAISKKMKLKDFLSMTVPYPTQAELFQRLALNQLKDSFKDWQKNLVKKLFLK